MALLKLFILMVASAIVTIYCEDLVFNLKHEGKVLQFDISSFEEIQTVYFPDNVNNITIKFKGIFCDGFRSKICLIKNDKYEIDIGSKINEVKLDVKNQLFMSLEGNTLCINNLKFTTDITFVCDREKPQNNIIIKPVLNECKYILELISITGCPVDDIDIRKVCNVEQLIPHSFYRVDLNRLRRLTTNYPVENLNRHFEVNICGRLTNSSKCKGNTTTICDITNLNNPEVFAVGSINDQLIFDPKSQCLKLIQHERAVKQNKGRQIEFIFKCNEAISPEKTKLELISDENSQTNHNRIAYFEVATSIVCIPRKELCELIDLDGRFNLNPLHKRVGNIIVKNPNEKSGYFYLNICSYLNQYNEEIPTSCTGKTSACYVDPTGKGTSIGSTQIGPKYTGNSLVLNYTNGANCMGSLKWSTIINFTCSDESLLIYDSTNSDYCVHVFQWKSRTACKILFEKNNHCSVTHPEFTGILYNFNSLKNQSFDYEIKDYEDNTQFHISICRPLRTPCNGNLDSAVCWFINGVEINIAIFTEEVVFDNGKIYMHMQGEQCGNDGPNSLTTIQFVCDYSDSKNVNLKKDIHECTFEFIIYTKHACSSPTKTNCTVDDGSGNIYDLSKLTKLDSNYEITIGPKKKIILNVCHSVINNNIDGIDCQLKSGICLVDSNYLLISHGYASLGDVNNIQKVENKIIIEMNNGFYNGHSVQSIIEFTCSNKTSGPLLMKSEDDRFIFIWYTPLACRTDVHKNIKEQIANYRIMPTPSISINGLNYSTYLCPKNDTNCNLVESNSNGFINSGRTIILTVNEKKIKYTLIQSSYFYYFIHESNNSCNGTENETEKIIFHFVCGYELQMPKLEKTSCIIKVRNIDPEMCSKKLECNTSWYNLTPLKGNYILKNKPEKYYISMCKPGEDGVGVMMEHNGKNYSIGYQVALPKTEVSDSVEIIFKGGDYCLEKKNLSKMYSSVIRLECDHSESKGYPAYMAKSQDKCELQFVWRTNLVCYRKLVEFNTSTCMANINGLMNSNIIDMKNILNTNQFFDSSTNTVYQVDFCNKCVCLNDTICFRSMNLEYDVYAKQFIAQFKEMNHDVINLNIKIACSNSNEHLSIATFATNDNGVIEINTYSKDVCCIDIDCSKETNCKKNIIPYTTTNIKNKSFPNPVNHEFSKFNLMGEHLNDNDLDEPVVSIREQIEAFNNNNTSFKKSFKQPPSSTQTNIPNMKKPASGTLFYFSGVILLILFVGIWFYRWKLLKEIRKILLSSSCIRRQGRHWFPLNRTNP